MKQLVIVTVGLAVALVVVASVLIPVLDNSTKTDDTFTNEGYFRMTHYGTDTDIIMTWSADKPKIMVVNDVEVPINYNVSGGQVTVIADTNFLVRFNSTGSLTWVGTAGGSYGANESATFTFSGGEVSASLVANGSTQTRTSTYSDLYLPSLDGPYVMKDFDKPSYINSDSDVFAYGLTRVKKADGALTPSPGYGLEFKGSIDDGITSRVWRDGGSTSFALLDDAQMNYEPSTSHLDLYSFTSITCTATFTETVDGETVVTETPVTYNYLLVPYQVTAERAAHFDPAQIGIISAIPILIIVAILLFAVTVFIRNRY